MDDKMNFFQQLSTLINSGTPLLQAIRICAQQNQSTRMQQSLKEIAARVAAGAKTREAAGEPVTDADDVGKDPASRRRMAARDQVRRLPHAHPPGPRQGLAADADRLLAVHRPRVA